MRLFLTITCLLLTTVVLSAASAPAVWPPVWVSDTNGGASGTNQDDHTGLDYGTDQWGYWANLDIEDGSGNPLATIEMRYIEPAAYKMGSFAGEQGVRYTELPRVDVPVTKLNGGNPFWVSALECTQQVWEEVKKDSTPGFEMKLTRWSKSFLSTDPAKRTDIFELNTASFPVDKGLVLEETNYSDYPINLADVPAWEATTASRFRPAFDAFKDVRALESQTFPACKDFCENELQSKIRTQSGSGSLQVRLPTEEEWEFVCRAGTSSPFWCGPSLPSVEYVAGGLSATKADFLFPFDETHIENNIADALSGDGNKHREWFSEGLTHIRVTGMTLDGKATPDHAVRRDIAGTITVSGTFTVEPVVANFDERYQEHYVPNIYGSYTPVLMTYVLQGANYIPKAYEPIGGNVYYRYKGTDTYVLASSITVGNTEVNKSLDFVTENMLPADTVPGDYGPLGQLEYLEMVPVVRCTATGIEDEAGRYTWDSEGNIIPIRTLYSKASFKKDGIFNGRTFPEWKVIDSKINEFANSVDLSDDPPNTMNVLEYVAKFKKECVDQLYKQIDPDPWYSGPKDFEVTYTETEFDVNGNPVEVIKTKTVTMKTIIPDSAHDQYLDNIEIVKNLTSALTGITPNEQMRNYFGLFNTHGNVAEWVEKYDTPGSAQNGWDGFSDHSSHKYAVDAINGYDPATGAALSGTDNIGDKQITRGGSWKNGATFCRSASRVVRDAYKAYDDVGFRFILTD